MEKVIVAVVVILILGFVIIKLNNELKLEKGINKNLSDMLEESRRKIYNMEYDIRQYEYFKTSLNLFPFDKAIKIVTNKDNDTYIVMDNNDSKNLFILFSGLRHPGICLCPRILATVRESYIWIDDIFAEDEDCGNGTLLLECLFEKAKDMEIKEIRGELSNVDKAKFNKLEHFYKKNGFEVWFSEDRENGGISKIIE